MARIMPTFYTSWPGWSSPPPIYPPMRSWWDFLFTLALCQFVLQTVHPIGTMVNHVILGATLFLVTFIFSDAIPCLYRIRLSEDMKEEKRKRCLIFFLKWKERNRIGQDLWQSKYTFAMLSEGLRTPDAGLSRWKGEKYSKLAKNQCEVRTIVENLRELWHQELETLKKMLETAELRK